MSGRMASIRQDKRVPPIFAPVPLQPSHEADPASVGSRIVDGLRQDTAHAAVMLHLRAGHVSKAAISTGRV